MGNSLTFVFSLQLELFIFIEIISQRRMKVEISPKKRVGFPHWNIFQTALIFTNFPRSNRYTIVHLNSYASAVHLGSQ